MDYNKLDQICTIAIYNLYTIGKDKKTIYLKGFDYKNKAHKCILNLALSARSMYGFDIKLDMKLIPFLIVKYSWKIALVKRMDKWEVAAAKVTVDEFINHIESCNEMPGVFEEIQTTYYEK